MSVIAGEIVKLQRPSAYWLERANRHRRQGNRRRAAALLRHAVSLSPADGELRVAYAQTLQEMECYEASNRAAFGALTLNPKRYDCYGLIGRNMLALGYQQEAMDAFSRYLWAVKQNDGIAEFDEELDALEAAENEHSRLPARYETQLMIAGRRLAAGDYARAERALNRAKPAANVDERYYSLYSLLLEARGDACGAVRAARRACRINPRSTQARCALAGAYCQNGRRAKGASTLLWATLSCDGAQDEQTVCYSAVSLGFPELALGALRRALKQSPDRLPTLFNTGVTMLKLGRIDDAESFFHRCRDLDPADVPSRCETRTLEQWKSLQLNPRQVRYTARALPFYPLLSPAQRNDCFAQIVHALAEGTDVFCQNLQTDESLYNLFVYQLGDPDHQLGRLLPLLAERLPADFAERLMREVLVLSTPDNGVKQFAAAALTQLNAKPPFVVWHAGRIAEIDPSVANRRGQSIPRAMLVRRLAELQRMGGGPRLLTHGLHAMLLLKVQRRERIACDTKGIYRTALEQHFLLANGLPETKSLRSLLRYNADDQRRLRNAFQALCRLMPLPPHSPKR
jgi:tetratricopeptide (TPR) repeat protein